MSDGHFLQKSILIWNKVGVKVIGHISFRNWKKIKNKKIWVRLIKNLFLLIYVLLIMSNKWSLYCHTTSRRYSSTFLKTLCSNGFFTRFGYTVCSKNLLKSLLHFFFHYDFTDFNPEKGTDSPGGNETKKRWFCFF